MRVLHLTTGRRSFFEQQVAALRDRGVDCTVLVVPGDYAADDPRSVADYLKYYPQVVREGLGDYDLVHANNGLTVPFALGGANSPVVATFWGSDLMGDHEWLGRLHRLGASLADRVVLPSRTLAEYVDCPYTHMPFPVDTELFRPMDRATARERVGWDPDERVVLFPYDPERPEKHYDRAVGVLDAADVDAELRTVTGKAHAEMPAYLNASDAVLVTSRRESGPMVVREAAACDVPVVSTDVGFVAETLADVDHSVVCQSDADLSRGLERVLEADRPSATGDSVPALGPDQFGRRLEQVYQSVVDSGARP